MAQMRFLLWWRSSYGRAGRTRSCSGNEQSKPRSFSVWYGVCEVVGGAPSANVRAARCVQKMNFDYVENCLAHFDEMMGLKAMIMKAGLYHLVSSMWKTLAERSFLWFWPSEIIKAVYSSLLSQLDQDCFLRRSSPFVEGEFALFV